MYSRVKLFFSKIRQIKPNLTIAFKLEDVSEWRETSEEIVPFALTQFERTLSDLWRVTVNRTKAPLPGDEQEELTPYLPATFWLTVASTATTFTLPFRSVAA